MSDVFCQQYKKQGTRSCTLHGSFIIDVNGNKKPNKVGRDMFYFYLSSEGYLIPQYGHDYYGYYWRNDALNGCGEPDKPLTSKSRSRGIGCAARIIENGWVMDY